MGLLRKQLQGNNFGQNSHTQYGATVPCAESEFEAISDIADASVLANEMQEDTRELNLITNTAQKAEDAGTIFDLAGDTVAAGGDVSEAAIAQADSEATDAALAVGVSPVDVTKITNDERTTIAGESAGRLNFRPAYGALRRDSARLKLTGESLFSFTKDLFSKAIEGAIKLYDKFCQWVYKYVGTFPRMLSAAKTVKENAANMSGKTIRDNTINLSGSIAKEFTLGPENPSDKKPYYITEYPMLERILTAYKKVTEVMIDASKEKDYDDLVDKLDSLDFSTATATKDFLKSILVFKKIDVTGISTTSSTNFTDNLFNDKSNKDLLKTTLVTMFPKYKLLVQVELNKTTTEIEAAVNDPDELDKIISVIDNLGFSSVNGDSNSKQSLKNDFNIKTFSAAQIEDICSVLIDIFETIINYRNARTFLNVLRKMRRLKDLVEKIKKDGDRTVPEEGANAQEKAMTRKLIKTASNITKRVVNNVNSMRTLIENLSSFYRATLDVCNKSLGAHKVND